MEKRKGAFLETKGDTAGRNEHTLKCDGEEKRKKEKTSEHAFAKTPFIKAEIDATPPPEGGRRRGGKNEWTISGSRPLPSNPPRVIALHEGKLSVKKGENPA